MYELTNNHIFTVRTNEMFSYIRKASIETKTYLIKKTTDMDARAMICVHNAMG